MAEDIQYPQFSADGLPITYVPDPFKADGAPVSSQWKDPVRVASNTDVALAGLQTLNGVSVMEGDRVLLKDQIDPAENGIWVVSAGDWQRARDMYLWPQFVSAVVAVEEGAGPGEEVWITSVAVSGTVGTTPVYWTTVSSATGTIPTFTPLRALVTNVVGEPIASSTTIVEIAFLSGVTSAVQTQFQFLYSQAGAAFNIAVSGTNAASAAQADADTAQSTANSAFSVAMIGTNTGSAAYSYAAQAYALAEDGTNIGSLAYTVATALGDKYVRTTRFASIGAGTGGAVTLPPNAVVVLDDFGGGIDAVVSTIAAARPTFSHAVTVTGAIVTTSFDAAGNYSFSGAPSAYPVALVYRVRQKLSEFDSTSTDIIGSYDLEDSSVFQVLTVTTGTLLVPANPPNPRVYLADSSAGPVVVALPNATGWTGEIVHVKKISADGQRVTVRSATGTATVDGLLEQWFTGPYTSIQVTTDGNNWYIL